MINKKRFLYPAVFVTLTCGALAVALHAENPADGGSNANNGANPPPAPHHGPPPMPLFDALDTNHDGVISADEITNASTALKSLLKEGATQITREDVRPPHPAAGRNEDQPRPRAHRPPPRDDRADDEAGDRVEHPHHRPPPPPEDADAADDGPHPRHHHHHGPPPDED